MTDQPVAEKIIAAVGRSPRLVLVANGKSVLDGRLARWTQPSNQKPMLVLRDWDVGDGASCPPELRSRLLGQGPHGKRFALRIVVRSVEAWLMADRAAAMEFFRTSRIPNEPELELDAKAALINACRKSPRSIRSGMVPNAGVERVAGPLYSAMLREFGTDRWNPQHARLNEPSLDRALTRMESLVATGVW